MKVKHKLVVIAATTVAIVIGAALYLVFNNHTVAVLQPKGTIAEQQRDLMGIALLLMLIVVVPVYVMTILIVTKYRAGNKKARYTPDWDGNKAVETIWWMVPTAIISILAFITWNSSHTLDPFRPISAEKAPMKVQVIALQWKWLFVYPEQNLASINELYIPEDTPIEFEITSDAPMNSFWVPQLGGQVYAMSGMSTQLHLMADEPGSYRGSSANLSGEGFAHMNFEVKAMTDTDFRAWADGVGNGINTLTYEEYDKLAVPSTGVGVTTYAHVQDNLYNAVTMKYMETDHHHTEGAN